MLGRSGVGGSAYGDLDTVVREDEGCVGGCELVGRHFDEALLKYGGFEGVRVVVRCLGRFLSGTLRSSSRCC